MLARFVSGDITSDLTTNPKRFWNWIKSFRGGSTTIPHLQYLRLTHRTATERANALNRYFTSVFTHETTYGIEELGDSLKPTRSKELNLVIAQTLSFERLPEYA